MGITGVCSNWWCLILFSATPLPFHRSCVSFRDLKVVPMWVFGVSIGESILYRISRGKPPTNHSKPLCNITQLQLAAVTSTTDVENREYSQSLKHNISRFLLNSRNILFS